MRSELTLAPTALFVRLWIRFGIVYLAEAPSTDAPHYRVSIGAPFSTVTTKLHRCLPQADGSGNLCEVVDEADTPSVRSVLARACC